MRAPPVYRTSTTPLRSESLRDVRLRMREKLGASSKHQAVLMALRRGLL
jgi:hypothetical protein